MSSHASFIPPDVIPPDPPEAKVVAFVFSAFMSVVLIMFIGYVCIDFLADIVGYSSSQNTLQEHALTEQYEPLLSEFLGIHFPGQDFGTGFGYELTSEDRERAIRRLQAMFLQTEEVSMEIICWDDRQQYITETHWLSWDNDLATELCEQANFINDTFIVSDSDIYVPVVVFTFFPSGVKMNARENFHAPLVDKPAMNITLGIGTQRWEGKFGDGMITALLNARLQEGETVRACVSEQLPFFPLDSTDDPKAEH